MDSVADPRDIEARVQRSREAVASAIEAIVATKPSVRPKSSPILALLEPYADQIRQAMADGWTAGAIARALHGKGVEFSEDAIRLRIAAAFRKASETAASDKPKRETKPKNNSSNPTATPIRSAAGAPTFDPRDQYKRKPKEEQW